ncbi:M20 family metallopeptidase [Priestia megaterium]|uniref:M20 family metallopeptidase n=1 Tax=Priestia megaterium TaxID=1404 RepID=UPI00366FDB0F
MYKETLYENINDVKQEVIKWRRYLHQNPELSFQEKHTAQFVYEKLQSFGNLVITRPTETSVMARLIGRKPGKVIAVRADMDALPIQEETQLDFASKTEGVMHACGHDGHTAMLLGTAKVLSQYQKNLHGEIRFLFQHGEEQFPGGAQEMIKAGVMDGVDSVIGCHLWAALEVGKVGIVYGEMMGAPDTFDILVKGKGGHGAIPHESIDSIAIGAQVITNLQHVVSRNVDPLERVVLSITKFAGGTTYNVIPGSVKISGTVRSLNPEMRTSIPKMMERIIKGITEAHEASYEFVYDKGYHPVINDNEMTKLIERSVIDGLGKQAVYKELPTLGGEDFSAYQQKAPGAFFYVGARNTEKGFIYPHHHPLFAIDEEALENGVKVLTNAALNFLETNV